MRRQLRIMVLYSSKTSRKILEVILLRAGHLAVSFGDPVEALRFLSQRGPVDLLLPLQRAPPDRRLRRAEVFERRTAFPLCSYHCPPRRRCRGAGPYQGLLGGRAAHAHQAARAAADRALVASHLHPGDGVPEEDQPTRIVYL
jgi:hypothetical protein